jgi:predicted component of type VI protein secretion system
VVDEQSSVGAARELEGTERFLPPRAAGGPRLLIVAADGTWTARPLPERGAVLIGRDPSADVRVEERAVSRLHARLERGADGQLVLRDLNSANGTLVGGRRVRDAAVPVAAGEPIVMGRTVLTVQLPDDELEEIGRAHV